MSTTPIPIDQFAAAIRAKHPGAYDNRSDAELVQAYVNKYPVYKDRVAGFAETNFEKEKSDAAPDRGAISGAGSALSSLNPFSGSNSYTDAVSGIAKMLFNPASAGTDTAKQAIQRTVSAANDPALKNLPVTKAIYTAGSALSPFVPGLNPESMSERASRADTSGIYGEAAIPTTLALAPYLKKGASSARSAISNAAYTDGAVNPKLAAIGDAIEHPTTIPGKLVKGTASALFPPPDMPEGAPIYRDATRLNVPFAGEEIEPPLGSPDNPAYSSKLPTRLPSNLRGDPFAPPVEPPTWQTPSHEDIYGSPDFPGPMSKIPNRIAIIKPTPEIDPLVQAIKEGRAAKLPVRIPIRKAESAPPSLFPNAISSNQPNLPSFELPPIPEGNPTPFPKIQKRSSVTPQENVSSDPFNPQSSPDDLISRMKKIAVPGEEPSAADLKRAGDFTQVDTPKLRILAKFGDKLAQNELNRRLKQ